jgi:dolichol-phosphate mannosyltransferase
MNKCAWLRFSKFAIVGLMGVALQLSLLALLTKHFRMLPVMATALAVEITLLHNFLWHERFTWRERRLKDFRQRARRLCRFHLGNGLVSLLGNTSLSYCLVVRLNAPPLPSAFASIALCSLANFALADRWVYDSSQQNRHFLSHHR